MKWLLSSVIKEVVLSFLLQSWRAPISTVKKVELITWKLVSNMFWRRSPNGQQRAGRLVQERAMWTLWPCGLRHSKFTGTHELVICLGIGPVVATVIASLVFPVVDMWLQVHDPIFCPVTRWMVCSAWESPVVTMPVVHAMAGIFIGHYCESKIYARQKKAKLMT